MARKSGRWRKEICTSGVRRRRRRRWGGEKACTNTHKHAHCQSYKQSKRDTGEREKREMARERLVGEKRKEGRKRERERGPSVVSVTAG